MPRLSWTLGAQRDLRSAHEYISRDSRRNADQVIADIQTAVQALITFPESGNPIFEDDRVIAREIYVHKYRIRYAVRRGVIRITDVKHGSLNWM